MNNNGLTVLAKRDNMVFILTPVYLVLFYFFRKLYGADIQGVSLLLRIPYIIAFAVAVVAIIRFVRRAFLPSVILEYDSMNLYINKGLKGTIMIPWGDVRSVDNLQVHGSLGGIFDAFHEFHLTRAGRRFALLQALWSLTETGIIVINCKDELVRVHGIKNAREVRNELHKIISQKRKNIDNGLRLR